MTRAPGIRHWIPLPYGEFGAFLQDPLSFQLRAQARYGDVFRFRIGPLLIHGLYHPDHVRHVLHDNGKNYVRGWQYRLLRGVLGNNLVVSEGEYWRRQRRLAQPAFHRHRLTGYAEVMVDATFQMLSRWRETATAAPVDIGREMSRLALAIAGRTLFDRDVSHESDSVGQAFAVGAQYLQRRLNRPFTTPPTWWPSASNRQFKQAIRTLNEVVLRIVQERRRESRDHGDLLSMLLHAQDEESGESMTDDEVRSEALAFLIAGHETTATALTWIWYLLATHPAVQQQARDEAEAVIGDSTPSAAHVQQLTTTRMVIEEAMRLYPPVWGLPRKAVQRDEIGGFTIPAGSTVLVSQYVTHRHPSVWDQPEKFDPQRFAPERVSSRPKGAYFPFWSGPHQCIGNEFATLEMQLILPMMLLEFQLELPPGPPAVPVAALTLRPVDPIRLIPRTLKRAGV